MSTATDMVTAYLAAETAILLGQSYRFGDRTLTMVNLPEIQKGRLEWEQRANDEARRAATAGFANQGPLSAYGADFGAGNRFAPEGGDGWSPLT